MRAIIVPLCLGLTSAVPAQSLTPEVVSTAGASNTSLPGSLDWTVGETMTVTLTASPVMLTQGFQQAEPVRLRIRLSVLLDGAYDPGAGLMRDDLRSGSLPVTYPLVPVAQPYSDAPWSYAGQETVASGVLAVAGSDAVVDWVLVELRSPMLPGVVVAQRAALLQRDGDVVEVDGVSPVGFDGLPSGAYHVAVRHRNHLGVMTASTLILGPIATSVDFTTASTATYGTNARRTVGGVSPVQVLWMGNARPDDRLKYTGTANDRDPILVRVGGSVPTNTVVGYYLEDNTLDGRVKYTGTGNDRDPILQALPGGVTSTRSEQLPTP